MEESSSGMEPVAKRQKRGYTRRTAEQQRVLEDAFQSHRNVSGGLTKPLKQRLAQELGLDYGVVANWFSARNIKAKREVATLGFEPTPDAALADAETAAPALAADPLKGTALAPDPVAEPTHGVAEASVGAEEASGAAVQHAVLDAVHGVVGGPPDVPDQPAARRGWLTSQRFKQVRARKEGNWFSYVVNGRKKIHAGTHPTEEEAAKARDKVLYKLHGDSVDFQVGLTDEEKRQLDELDLEQIKAQGVLSPGGFGTTSRFRGVSWDEKLQRWKAQIKQSKGPGQGWKSHHLGFFDSEEEAARRYDAAARQMLPGKAKTNFVAENVPMGIIQQPLVDQEQLGQSVPIQNVAAAAVAGDAQTEDPDQERLGFAELLQGGDAGDVNAGPHTTTPFQLHDVAASTAAPAAAEMASSCQGAAEQDSHEQLTPLAQQDVTGMVVFPEQAMGWVRLPVGSAYALRLDADVLQDDHLTLSEDVARNLLPEGTHDNVTIMDAANQRIWALKVLHYKKPHQMWQLSGGWEDAVAGLGVKAGDVLMLQKTDVLGVFLVQVQHAGQQPLYA